jgi:hypothetical protein
MTIQFACNCGQQLAAREEFAGKRVRCTSCGEIRTVPDRAANKPPTRTAAPPAAPELIRFHCSCGQICQARPEFAGRNTRCPSCSTVLTIPGGAITREAQAPRRPPVHEEEAVRRSASRRPVEDKEEEVEEVRPRRRRRKKSKLWIWISAAAALLLAGGGVALWLLLRGVSNDFDLVPRDAHVFITVRVADLVDSPLGKKVVDRLGVRAKGLEEWEAKIGLSRKDIERVTVVLPDVQQIDVAWIIVQTNKGYDKEKILSSFKQGGAVNEKKAGGKKYHVAGLRSALCFYSDRLLVWGSTSGMEKCLTLPKPRSGPLDEVLEMASKKKNQYVVGLNLPPAMMTQAREGMKQAGGGMFAGFTSLLEFNTGYMTMAVNEDIDWEFGFTFPDNQKAKTAKETFSGLVSTLKVFLPAIEQAMKQRGINQGKGKDFQAEARKQLDALNPKQNGKTVTFGGHTTGKEFMDSLDDSLNLWMNIPNFGGGR